MQNSKKVLVIGGNGGIGQAIVKELKENKFDVYVTYNESIGRELKEYYSENEVQCMHMNLLDMNSIEKIDLSEFNSIIFAAGTACSSLLENTTLEELHNNMNLQVIHPLYMIQKWLEQAQCIENIIFITSNAGLKLYEAGGVYGFTKATVITLVKMLAEELSRYSISINAIAPGWVETKMAKYVLEKNNSSIEEEKSKKIDNSLVYPSDVAKWCLHILQSRINRITGQIIEINSFNRKE